MTKLGEFFHKGVDSHVTLVTLSGFNQGKSRRRRSTLVPHLVNFIKKSRKKYYLKAFYRQVLQKMECPKSVVARLSKECSQKGLFVGSCGSVSIRNG
jgi:hypothetical protein